MRGGRHAGPSQDCANQLGDASVLVVVVPVVVVVVVVIVGVDENAGELEVVDVLAQAEAAEILVTRDTLEGAGTGFRLSEPRSEVFKGLEQPIEVVAVDWR